MKLLHIIWDDTVKADDGMVVGTRGNGAEKTSVIKASGRDSDEAKGFSG